MPSLSQVLSSDRKVSRQSRPASLRVAYMLKRQDGFRLFLDDGRVDIDSNFVENAIRSPAMNRRNALFAGHDEGGRNWARFASLIGTCKMNGVEPYAYLRDLFTKLNPSNAASAVQPRVLRTNRSPGSIA
jgi:transposase